MFRSPSNDNARLAIPWRVGDMLQPLSRTAKYATTKGIIQCPARTRINSAAQMETRCQCPSIVPGIRQCCGLFACRAQFNTGHGLSRGPRPDPAPRQWRSLPELFRQIFKSCRAVKPLYQYSPCTAQGIPGSRDARWSPGTRRLCLLPCQGQGQDSTRSPTIAAQVGLRAAAATHLLQRMLGIKSLHQGLRRQS